MGTDIDGVMGTKHGLVANYALIRPYIVRNRIYEKQRKRTRGEPNSGRQYGSGLMNPEITELARVEETFMHLPTTITRRPNPSTKSHERVRWMTLVFGFDLNTKHCSCSQRMHFEIAIFTFVGEIGTSFEDKFCVS